MAALPTPIINSCAFNASDQLVVTVTKTGDIETTYHGVLRVLYATVETLQNSLGQDLTLAQLRNIMINEPDASLSPIISTAAWSASIIFNQNTVGFDMSNSAQAPFNAVTGDVYLLEYRFPLPDDDDGFTTTVTLANSNLVEKNTITAAMTLVP